MIMPRVAYSKADFYTFFSTKEDLILEVLYLQQPKILEAARNLVRDTSLSWREAVTKLLYACCYGAADAAADFQIKALVDFLESLRSQTE